MAAARLAQTEDAETVAALLIEFRDWFGNDQPDGSIRASVRRLIDDPQTEYLLAGDPPDGICQLRYRHSVWTGSEDCCLEDLFVRDRARGDGLGRTLVEAALGRARARGCRRIELDVDSRNAPARALYESLGFASGSTGAAGESLFMRARL